MALWNMILTTTTTKIKCLKLKNEVILFSNCVAFKSMSLDASVVWKQLISLSFFCLFARLYCGFFVDVSLFCPKKIKRVVQALINTIYQSDNPRNKGKNCRFLTLGLKILSEMELMRNISCMNYYITPISYALMFCSVSKIYVVQ